MRRTTAAVGALALALAACATGEPGLSDARPSRGIPESTAATLARSGAAASELGALVVPGDGSLPPDLIVGCPNGPTFPFSALSGIGAIEPDDPDGLLAAIEPFLQNEEGQFWPQEDWSLLHGDGEDATLVAKTGDGSLAYMNLIMDAGSWKWSGASMGGASCDLQYQLPPGLNLVTWALDPSRPAPDAGATEIHFLLTESECVSGMPIGDRLLAPQVIMTDAEVHIAFAATPPPGDAQTCQGNPTTAFDLSLPAPLGDRQIVPAMNIGFALEDYLGD